MRIKTAVQAHSSVRICCPPLRQLLASAERSMAARGWIFYLPMQYPSVELLFMREEPSHEVYVLYFLEYLDRVVPPKLELPADFHEHAQNWAERTITADRNPLDVAREQLVELWEHLRLFRDPPPEYSEVLAALLFSLVRSEQFNDIDPQDKLSKDKRQNSDPPWSNCDLSSVNSSKYEAALRACQEICLPSFPGYGDRVDLDQIRHDAATIVATKWDEV